MKKLLLVVMLCALSPVASFGKLLRQPQQQQQSQQPATTATTQTPAQPPATNPCDAPEFRQFDFWVGTWTVKDQKGNEIGKSEIMKVANGCGIRETWNGGVGLNSGTSINYYDKSSGRWRQDWVGSGGSVLHLTGAFEKQTMSLSGERQMPKGRVLDRINWTLLPDGRVLQEWNISTDNGATWKKTFEGFYSRQ